MAKLKCGNIYANIPAIKLKEVFETILVDKKVKIERIISRGHRTDKGKWLKQAGGEWVIVLKGAGNLRFFGDNRLLALKPGDYVFIPGNTIHRLEWTPPAQETIWLAVHNRK